MIESWFNQDLKEPVKVRYLDGNVFSADNAGNLIGVNVFSNGQPASLGGTVSANVIRSDGVTVPVSGALSGNKVTVVLNQSCYAVSGPISIIFKITYNGAITTVCAVVANVYQSSTDAVVDPGTIIPSIETLISEIEAAVASIPADYSSLWTTLAPTYSTSSTYAVGDYVTYNGALYRCISPITSGESWTASHWAVAKVGPDIHAINKAISYNYILDRPFATYSGHFVSGSQYLNTYVILKPGKSYIIANRTQLSGNVIVAGAQDSVHYKKLNASVNVAVLSVYDTERYLILTPQRSGVTDAVELEIYELDYRKVNTEPEVYVVNNTEPEYGEYTSFTKCLFELKNNENEKIIYVDGGDYNIFSEYKELWDAGLLPKYTGTNAPSDYYDYCVWVPKNTHIIGRGIARLVWTPTVSGNPELTAAIGQTISPLNVAGSAIIENIDIICSNGRYCIHDDPQKPGSSTTPDLYKSGEFSLARKIYKNVNCYKLPNETIGGVQCGFAHTIGFGCHKEMYYEFDNCYFNNIANGYSFYGHTEAYAGNELIYYPMSSNFVLNNCVINTNGQVAVSLENVSSDRLRCQVKFDSCYLSGQLRLVSANPSDPGRPNAWDITLLNCGSVSYYCDDSNNRYPPKAFGTTLTNI